MFESFCYLILKCLAKSYYICPDFQCMFRNQKNLKKITFSLCFVFIAWFLLYFLIGKTFPYEFANQNFKLLFPKIIVFLAAVSIYTLLLMQIDLAKKWEFSNVLKFVGGIILGFVPFILYGFFSIQSCPFWLQSHENSKTLFRSKLNQNEKIIVQKTHCTDIHSSYKDTIQTTTYFNFIRTSHSVKPSEMNQKYWQKISL